MTPGLGSTTAAFPLHGALRRLAPALLAAAALAACGGGSDAPGDTTGPTVVITDDVPGATATGDVTFTFTFSEDVGTSFIAADVTVSGGTKGVFTKVSGTVTTMVVVPTPNAQGTINVSVAAGAFTDLAGNANAGTAGASQPYDTTVTLTQMSLPVSFDSATVDYGLVGFGGADDSTIVADPAGGSNKVARVLKSATAEVWAGTTVTALDGAVQTGFASAIPFDASNTRMTVRTYSPDAGIKVRLKVEDHADPAVSVETEATTTAAGAWETLTFDFAAQASGTAALDLAKSYDKASIFFNFGVGGATAGEKVYYFDDVTFIGGGGTGGGAAPATLPPAPTKAAGPEVYALHSSVTGGYAGTASDQSGKVDTWLTSWSAGTGGTTASITAAGGTASPRTYTFTAAAPFVGIEFIGASGVNEIDAAGLGLDTLHVDLWTPDNASNFQLKLVDFGADGAFGGGDDTEGIATLTAGSTPPLATGTWLSYDLKLASAFPGLANLHHLAQLVLVAPNGGTMYLDNLYFYKGDAAPPPAGPAAPPASPTPVQADVISLLSAVYADRAVDTWSTSWDQATLTELTLGGVPVKQYGPLAFAGIEFIGAAGVNEIDATAMTHFHVDVWTPDVTNFQVKLVDFGADAGFGGGDDTEALFTAHAGTTPALSGTQQWVSLDIPLASFVPAGASWNRAHLAQLLFISGTGNGTAYVTNIYFHK